jgi:hypothetical protein
MVWQEILVIPPTPLEAALSTIHRNRENLTLDLSDLTCPGNLHVMLMGLLDQWLGALLSQSTSTRAVLFGW